MKQYNELLRHVLHNGEDIDNERTGVGTIATFGEQIKFDLRNGFPAVTTKKLAFKSLTSEMIWFLRGSDNVNDLREILHGKENRTNPEKKTIWDANYNEQAIALGYTDGFMGDIYGSQWRNFGREHVYFDSMNKSGNWDEPISGVDQVKCIIEEAKTNPASRRLIVSAWNPKAVWAYSDDWVSVDKAALPPCHMQFQINIVDDYIDLQWYQRSVDAFLGLPFNIASYAEICHVLGRILGKTPRYLIGSLGNVHIYKNHIDQVLLQLERDTFKLPELWINPDLKTLEDFEKSTIDDYKLIGYNHHSQIKAEMAV